MKLDRTENLLKELLDFKLVTDISINRSEITVFWVDNHAHYEIEESIQNTLIKILNIQNSLNDME